MSFAGPPSSSLSASDFYSQALQEADAGKRRRLFADARSSNPASYQLWVKAAEVEEHWGADQTKLKELLSRGLIQFKNPAGSAGTGFGSPNLMPITKDTWLHEASAAETAGKSKTAAALHDAVKEVLVE
ncbi:hypothetical protein BGX29_009694 [Mortierella sp. GBA35]|nr:hypothetical protein BGX23_006903 [Mortierella sp. AD031]KAF9094055.1 hypothetical protein BGX29_009694 [Mortierella sp. GBA35]KAG0206838.1 hypothetical protein BGX33_007191 [Mortierella sp. NVP41]